MLHQSRLEACLLFLELGQFPEPLAVAPLAQPGLDLLHLRFAHVLLPLATSESAVFAAAVFPPPQVLIRPAPVVRGGAAAPGAPALDPLYHQARDRRLRFVLFLLRAHGWWRFHGGSSILATSKVVPQSRPFHVTLHGARSCAGRWVVAVTGRVAEISRIRVFRTS